MKCIYLLTIFQILVDSKTYFQSKDFDWSIRPTDDFYTFVNGHWLEQTVIPPSLTEWGSLYTITYETLYKLKTILDELTLNGTSQSPHPVGSIYRKLSDLYLSGLDEQKIETIGIEPLKQTLIQLNNIQTSNELIIFILNWYKRTDQGLLFLFEVYSDEKNSSINIPFWKQHGIELPERDFYFRNDLNSKNIRLNYINYIHRLLNLTDHLFNNQTTNLIDAEDILTLETQLAAAHQTPTQLRDTEKNYYKYTVYELHSRMPNLNWKEMFRILDIVNTTIIMQQLDYYQLLDRLIVNQPLNIWKNKIRFSILHQMSKYLNKDFVEARFEMFERILFGRLVDKPKWMKIIEDINKYIGELFGQLYVQRYFSFHAKQRTLNLTNHLIKIYRQRILRNEWMSNETKEKALIKLEKINTKIGYPSRWKSYIDVQIDRRSYFQSMCSIFQYTYRKKIRDLYQKPDRDEWFIPPQTVNAFYNPLFNEILFPAAILQEPFFSFHADDAINYGAIGSIIAHELTHGFDDQGRKYDENGNLQSWWTINDINQFNSRTKLLAEQFNNYTLLQTNINGWLTLGENIADLGGLEIAYEAFLETEQAISGEAIDGFLPTQRFFLAFAHAIRVKITDAKQFILIKTDPHAPSIFRVNGPFSNHIGFYQAFNVTKNDRLFREKAQRVLIW